MRAAETDTAHIVKRLGLGMQAIDSCFITFTEYVTTTKKHKVSRAMIPALSSHCMPSSILIDKLSKIKRYFVIMHVRNYQFASTRITHALAHAFQPHSAIFLFQLSYLFFSPRNALIFFNNSKKKVIKPLIPAYSLLKKNAETPLFLWTE